VIDGCFPVRMSVTTGPLTLKY